MEKLIENLLLAGIQAPSGDNLQPWRFSLSGEVIQVFVDPQRDKSFFNFKQCATILSVGAVVENLSQATKFFGLESKFEFQLKKDLKDLWEIGKFRYQKNSRKFSKDKEQTFKKSALFRRCTNRKPYKKVGLDSQIFSNFEAISKDLPVELEVFQGQAQEELAKLIYLADIIRVERKDLHHFLHETIRWSKEEIEQKKDGMPIETLEAGKAGELFLKATKPWPVMNFLNRLGFSKALAAHTKKLALSSGALLAFCVERFDDQGFFEAGRAMERIWLKATEFGLAVQPLAAAPLFLIRWKTGDKFSFAPKHQNIMARIEAGFDRLKIPGCIMILRIGMQNPPKAYAPRKPIEKFVI